ncbi:MAG TPA: sodium/proton-translocating pyrophosphatase, partial [Bacteroidales bacterium]|nr:sodium/proton-translocating pyrophosphatase [Bacteroidales bacterium]
MLNPVFWLVPVASLIALFFAWFFFKQMMKNSEGNDTMKEIARHVRDGANAYLSSQYRVVALVFLVLVILLGVLAF